MKYSIFLSAILITWMGVYTPSLSFSGKKENSPLQEANAVCQNAVLDLNIDGQARLLPSDIDDGSSGDGTLSFSLSDTAFDCSDIGAQVVTLTVSDDSSSASCTAMVSIQDVTPPTPKCQNIIVQLDESGEVAIATSDVDGGSSDACGIMSITIDNDDFTCTDVSSFSKIVNLSLMDSSQNMADCQALVKVEDNLPPALACQNITLELDATGGAKLAPSDVLTVASDNCGISSLTIDRDSFSCGDISQFNKIVNLQATDIHGNDSSCQALVKVKDDRNPTALCQDITVALDANGEYYLSSSEIDNASSDNCGIATQALSVSSFSCLQTSAAVPVKLYLVDIHANQDSCEALVTVQDTLAPQATCQDITVYLDNTGSYSLTSSEIENGSSDNCGIDNISIPPSTFDCNMATAMVRLSVTDVHNNLDTCMAQVFIKDTLSPTANCQALTLYLDQAGNVSLASSAFDNYSDDNCGKAALLLSTDSTEFDCRHVGNHPVTLTVTDASSNSSSCSSMVTIVDSVAPVAVCQALTVQLDSMGLATIMSSDLDNGSTDACGLLSLTASKYAFDCSDLQNSMQSLTLTVTDVNNNSHSCQSMVNIQDTIGPVVTCSNITLYLDTKGEAEIMASDVGQASDNCILKSVGISQNAFNCNHLGINSINFAAEDSSANLSLCNPQVEVRDTLSPMITCPPDEVALADNNCQAALLDFTSKVSPSDNCTIIPAVSQFPPVNTLLADTSTITLTATDGSNNASSCTFNFIVIDEADPVVTCKNIVVELDSSGMASISPDDVTDSKMDNCTAANDLRMSLSRTQLDCIDADSVNISLILTAIDESDNTDSCQAIVTVRDNIAPVVTCADSMEVELGVIEQVMVNVTMTDNCRIEDVTYPFNVYTCNLVATYVPITILVEDPSGNITPCTTTVFVKDTAEAKWTSRPPNIVRCGEQLVDWAEPTATFPCERSPVVSYLTQPEGLVKGGAFPVGNTQVFYELEDVLVQKSLEYDFFIEILPIPVIENYSNGDEFIATSLEDFELMPKADVQDVSYLWELQLSEFLEASPPLPTELTAGPLIQTFSFTDARSVGEALYKITPVFADSCIGEPVQVLVKVLPGKGTFFVPEMFTPNGDGINDDWGARLLTDGNPDDYRIEVFNQAGGKMYTSISLSNRWNGGDCPDGPYWYVIERKDTGERVKTGGVTIQR